MNELTTEQEKRFLRWGGFAGVAGSVLFIAVFAIVIVFVGPDLVEPEGLLKRFPDIRPARTAENGLYLVVLILWAIHFLALYRALRKNSVGTVLVGSVLGMVGLTVLAAGALPHVTTIPISDHYHAPGTTAAEQAALVVIFSTMQAMFDALLIAGLCILPVAVLALGLGMLRNPAFGKAFGGLSVALGTVGIVVGGVLLVDPASPVAVAGVLALIVFHLVLGWKLVGLSRAK